MKRFRFIILLVALVAIFPLALNSVTAVSLPVSSMELSNTVYAVGCGIVLAVFSILLVFMMLSGMLLPVPLLFGGGIFLAAILMLTGLGLLLVRTASSAIDLVAYIGSPALITVIYLFVYFIFRRRAVTSASVSIRRSAAATAAVRYDFKVLYGALVASIVTAIVAACAGEPTHYLMIPIAITTLAFLLWRVCKLRLFLLLGFMALEYYILSTCIPAVSITSTTGFVKVLVLSLIYMSLLTPLADLYCHKSPIA